jgi:hypothetical protein
MQPPAPFAVRPVETALIPLIDVVLPTRMGNHIRSRCNSKPSNHYQISLEQSQLRQKRTIKQNQVS